MKKNEKKIYLWPKRRQRRLLGPFLVYILSMIMQRPNKCIIADTKHSYIIYLQVLQQT
jgi:hypothetical protein